MTLKERIKTALKQNKPFTSYRKPNENNITFISQNNNDIHYLDNYLQKGFVFAPFDTSQKSVFFSLKYGK